jgi:hypothetical protein
MARGAGTVVRRVRALAARRQVRFTLKALRELALMGLDELDACETLAGLAVTDFVQALRSTVTGEWLYVFKPRLGGVPVYVKLILRGACVVVSFHEDEDGHDEDNA